MRGRFSAMIRRIPAFQQAAVCLTKFGPESGETAEEIVARKDLERRAGLGSHKNEFCWGVGEKGTAQSTRTLISRHGGNTVLFSAIKGQTPPDKGSATDALVWRKYRMLGGDILQDIPKRVLITSAAVTKGGATPTKHFALVCNSSVALLMVTRRIVATIGFLVTLGSGTSIAISPQDMFAEAKACKAIANDKDRLKCFDRLFTEPSGPQTSSGSSASELVNRREQNPQPMEVLK
jgi:hypothetical protein